jgi:hypothetical protein
MNDVRALRQKPFECTVGALGTTWHGEPAPTVRRIDNRRRTALRQKRPIPSRSRTVKMDDVCTGCVLAYCPDVKNELTSTLKVERNVADTSRFQSIAFKRFRMP